MKVTLVEFNKILSSFDARLSAFAERKIKQRKGFELIRSSVVGMRLFFSNLFCSACLYAFLYTHVGLYKHHLLLWVYVSYIVLVTYI